MRQHVDSTRRQIPSRRAARIVVEGAIAIIRVQRTPRVPCLVSPSR